MDALSVIVGIIIGFVFVGFAIELGLRKTNPKQSSSRPTHKWSISEIPNPRIIAEYMGDIKLPRNAKVVVNNYENKDLLKGKQVKHHSGIRGNYILGENRALVLSGPIKEDELGIWTVEKEMLDKLNKYFEDSWYKAKDIKNEE
jgi:hypothetical protein